MKENVKLLAKWIETGECERSEIKVKTGACNNVFVFKHNYRKSRYFKFLHYFSSFLTDNLRPRHGTYRSVPDQNGSDMLRRLR